MISVSWSHTEQSESCPLQQGSVDRFPHKHSSVYKGESQSQSPASSLVAPVNLEKYSGL